MTAVNCPMCELRFATKTERDWHLTNEHQRAHLHAPANRETSWRHAPGREPEPKPEGEAQT